MSRPGPQGSPRMSPRNGSPSLSPAYMPHPSAIPDPQRYSAQSPNRNSEYRNSSSSPRRSPRSYNDPSYVPQGGNRQSYADPASANRQSTHNPNAGSGRRVTHSGSETSSGRHTTSSGGHRQPSPNSQNRNSTRPRPSPNGYGGPGGSGPRPGQGGGSYRRDPEAAAYTRQNLNRQRSLTRPERQRQRTPMIRDGLSYIEDAPTGPQRRKSLARQPRPQREMSAQRSAQPSQQILQQAQAAKKSMVKPKQKLSWWAITARILTCCCPSWCMRVCCKMNDSLVQQAWREKVSLCYVILFCCSCLAFLTFALRDVLCPDERTLNPYTTVEANGKLEKAFYKNITVYGEVYPFDVMQKFFQTVNLTLPVDYENTDMSALFDADTNHDCFIYDQSYTNGTTHGECVVYDPYGGWIQLPDLSCINITTLRAFYKAYTAVSFEWSDLVPGGISHSNLLVYGDTVLNITYYLDSKSYFFGYNTHLALTSSLGLDGSSLLTRYPDSLAATNCLLARYSVGVISSDSMGCVASQLITDVTLVVIVGLIFVRFTMAVVFQWFISSSLVKPGGRSGILAWRSQAGGNYAPENERPSSVYSGAIPTTSNSSLGNTSTASGTVPSPLGPNQTLVNQSLESVSMANTPIGAEIVNTRMYTTMLVTCYSEGEASLRTTLDSLAATDYSTKHKLFFIIADGIITGSGNDQSTPDICISLLTLDPTMADPAPCTYMAVADGEKQLNMAKVYAGHYKYGETSVPAILVVKTGTPEENSKPGNRGKRDSQLILMSFFQRILFNDRLTELDYELFWKITWLMRGVTPDKFELVLMVDADTKVLPDSLTYMVAAMVNDITIMGLCGETRIANKKTSWVTGIQVFEYYISHHYAKGFESVFGGVTCLPGCFCMYRIKAPKNGAWVPILANPDIVLEYNQNVVTTLHAKNLLLLGEDRFLSTLMLRTFPKRQMMFVPQARCKTVVPDSFSVLLSQRRRWINSTVHNLMELVLVSDLCGIACLSMQFAVFLELIGTIVLPAAICFTVWLIIDTAITSNPQLEPLIILAAILGLPALLIVMTTRKMVYIMWMFVYLAALPVWNFILPVYSFWHFDDFSWGQTRKVAGEVKGHDHSNPEGEFDSSRIVMKKWEEWERERLGQKKFKTVRTNLKTPTDFASGKSDDISTAASLSAAYGNRKMFGSPTNNFRNSVATPSSILLHPDNSYRASSFMPQGAPGSPDTRRFSGALQSSGSRGSLSIPGSNPQMTAYQRQSAASPIPLQTMPNRSSTSINSGSDSSSFIGTEPVNISSAQDTTQRSSQLPLLAQQQDAASYSSSQSYEMQSQQTAADPAAAGQGHGYNQNAGYQRSQSNDDDNITLVSSTSTAPHVRGTPEQQRSEGSEKELLNESEGGDVRLSRGMQEFERGRRREVEEVEEVEEEEDEEEEDEEEEGPR